MEKGLLAAPAVRILQRRPVRPAASATTAAGSCEAAGTTKGRTPTSATLQLPSDATRSRSGLNGEGRQEMRYETLQMINTRHGLWDCSVTH
jgi:hypothetical protein